MKRVQASTPLTPDASRMRRGAPRPDGLRAEWESARALRALGALGLLGVLSTVFLLTAGVASRPSQYVPARSGGWPGWMAGPLQGLGIPITPDRFQTLILIMSASYIAVLLAVQHAVRASAGGHDHRRAPRAAARPAADLPRRLRLPRFRPSGRPTRAGPLYARRRPGAYGRRLSIHWLAFPALSLWPPVHARELRDRATRARRRAVGDEGASGRLEPRCGGAHRTRSRRSWANHRAGRLRSWA